jgi:hypothetical protein
VEVKVNDFHASEPGSQPLGLAPTLLTTGAMSSQAAKPEVSSRNVIAEARMIKVYVASGEHVELTLQVGDTIWHLSRRIADLKGVGWAILLLGTEPMDEQSAAASIPEGQTVTAMLQDGWDRPDRLNKTVQEQIRRSLDMHRVIRMMQCEQLSIEDAFQSSDWSAFRSICQPIQDFIITVFEFAGQRYVEYNFGLGDNGFGSLHAVNSVEAIMSYDDGTWEPLVEPWKDVHQHVSCDKCNSCPLIGTRYKSLEIDDYDLCEECFASEERRSDAWVQPPPDDENHDDDQDSDSDDDLHPFFAALERAIKANKLATYGVEW